MIPLSNEDFKKAVRLLKVLASQKGDTSKDREMSRRAVLLVRKLERKKRLLRASNSADNKTIIR